MRVCLWILSIAADIDLCVDVAAVGWIYNWRTFYLIFFPQNNTSFLFNSLYFSFNTCVLSLCVSHIVNL